MWLKTNSYNVNKSAGREWETIGRCHLQKKSKKKRAREKRGKEKKKYK
jgi:hypothetical protein